MGTRLSVFGQVLRRTASGYNGWATWVNDPGVDNSQDTFEGGEPASVPYAVLDLSAAASVALGKQVSQSQKFRLRRVQIGYRHLDVGIVNESDASFQGVLKWFADTDHMRQAVSLARQVEQAGEEWTVDADSFLLSTEKDYTALRLGWNGSTGEVQHPTIENLSALNGDHWNMDALAGVYNTMTAPDQTNALFNGRFPGHQGLGWCATISSASASTADGVARGGPYDDFVADGLLHDVGMGLMACEVTHSSPSEHQGLIEDDYEWWIGLDFEVME